MTTEAQITRTEEIDIVADPPVRERMTPARVRELFEDARYDPRSYSGRAMYGAECLAVTTDSASEAVTVILDVVQACAENGTAEDVVELLDLLRGSRTDGWGRSSVVVYWPDLAWADCGADEKTYDEDEDGLPVTRRDSEDFHSDG